MSFTWLKSWITLLLNLRNNLTNCTHPSNCWMINYLARFLCGFSVLGSLPPSPADSGVSDVDSSSSGHASTDELKARLQPSIHSPVGNLFSRHPALNWNGPIHQHTQRQGHLSQQFYQPFATSEFLSINAEQIFVCIERYSVFKIRVAWQQAKRILSGTM